MGRQRVEPAGNHTTTSRAGWRNASLAAASVALAAILCLGPLPFGSVLVRERTGLQLCAFAALAGAVLWQRLDRSRSLRSPPPGLPSFLPPLAIAAIGVWGMVQSLPAPAALVRWLSPTVAAAWDEAATYLGDGSVASHLSLAPAVSLTTGLHWLAVAACMATAILVSRVRAVRRILAGGLVAVAGFEVAYGADKWLKRSDVMWGMTVAGDPSRFRGTFINANHLAFYLLLATAVALAALWWSARRIVRRGPIEKRLLLVFPPAMAFLVFFACIAFTGSRAGLLATVAATLAFALLLAIHYRRWRVGLLAAGAVALGAAGVAFLGLRQGLERWAATSAYDVTWSSRWTVYRASWDLWRGSPWTGTGLGTFREAFPTVQPQTLSGAWIHAHSDPLEILVTAGLVAVPILGVGLAAFARRTFRVFQTGPRSEDRAAGLAALVAVSGASLHSMVDFALTIPANAFTLAILCGLALGVPLAGQATPSPRAP